MKYYVQVLSTLRVLAKGDFQSEAVDLHGISQSSFSRVIDVIDAFNDNLKNINFSTDTANLMKIKADFYKLVNFPNVVGAVDAWHSDSDPCHVQ